MKKGYELAVVKHPTYTMFYFLTVSKLDFLYKSSSICYFWTKMT